MKVTRKIIQIDEERCDGCGNCVLSCAEGALIIVDGKARVISDNLCDGLGACMGECPQDALHIIEREAEEFDEEAVEKHLETRKDAPEESKTMPCGCPSTKIQSFAPTGNCRDANVPRTQKAAPAQSALAHWPVQIRLIPPTAPFLKGADLLVVADCVPVAFPTLHRDFLAGKAVMIGCPKFDDAQDYIDRFAEIFKTAGVNSVTTVVMEVPCCSGLPTIVKKGMEKAGVQVPAKQVTISTQGEILETR
ncbi:ferredoxin [Desulfosarcina ovata subsp. sediminis]|uniref:Ferredoxin n=1 Tax=Desulfosarcina ovata subsp. sediminis TaxID=885957 RepID=A0A5K7ZNT0_9BACT|nr:4Fe-4S binding protein [Desulfosarcina ovata]BBO82921.1 ferredoxin [Desulfosarcina ovata subsp. sediminis]